MPLFFSTIPSIPDLQKGLYDRHQELKALPLIKFNRNPTTKEEYQKTLSGMTTLYNEILSSQDPGVLYALSKQNINPKNDLLSVSLPKSLCLEQINSGFWSTNIVNILSGKTWFISQPKAWFTHLAGIYNLVGRTNWLTSKVPFGNNLITKMIALLVTTLAAAFGITGITILGSAHLLRKTITSILSLGCFGLAMFFAGMSWAFNKLYGGQLLGCVQKLVDDIWSQVRREPEPALVVSKKNIFSRHPFLTTGIGLGVAGVMGYFFRAPLSQFGSKTLEYATQFKPIKKALEIGADSFSFVTNMQPITKGIAIGKFIGNTIATTASFALSSLTDPSMILRIIKSRLFPEEKKGVVNI
jgi:hypothetical protein